MNLKPENIPHALRNCAQWVLWNSQRRDGEPTKVPYQLTGQPAKSSDPSTWSAFEEVLAAYNAGQWSGIGFVFSLDDPFIGIDLDGCRDPKSGVVADWAKEIILQLDSYAEVSPSLTGVKIFCCGESPFTSGKKILVHNVERVCDKQPAIEVYDKGRYFTVTGWRLQGEPEIQERSDKLTKIAGKYAPVDEPAFATPRFDSDDAVLDRARKYLATIPPAISGQSGHNATFRAACCMVLGFGLDESEAFGLLAEWNANCQPPWSERDLRRKVQEANKQTGERNYLRNVPLHKLQDVKLPSYKYQAPTVEKREPRQTTLLQATIDYCEKIQAGAVELVSTGLSDLDYALAGGLEFGELTLLCARPSHGKSAVALQCIHNWTIEGRPCLFISEEMSSLALGKRSLQFLSDIPEAHWFTSIRRLSQQVVAYSEGRAPCYIVEGCGTCDAAVEQIRKAKELQQIQCVIVDYAQLLTSPGKSRYEQVTQTSLALRKVATECQIVLLVLCQLSRAIELRPKFVPTMSDIKETGQLEQDADVIIFLVWPHRLDPANSPNEFKFYISKNRNRAINQGVVLAKFNPSRQRVDALPPANYVESFDDWNNA